MMRVRESNTMNRQPLAQSMAVSSLHRHPNEIDKKRIERALVDRKRYRYVTPQVGLIDSGYVITSPCCSRNIEPNGGVIDIAMLEFLETDQFWRLFYKDHSAVAWVAYADYPALPPILALLREDPERRFWQ